MRDGGLKLRTENVYIQLVTGLCVLLFAYSCKSSNQVSSPNAATWEHPQYTLETCGQEGSVPQKVADCHEKNPHFSFIRDDRHGASWQLLSFQTKHFRALWIDRSTNLIWSTPLQGSDSEACSVNFPQSDPRDNLQWRLPTAAEYQAVFTYGFPATLAAQGARFFSYQTESKSPMVFDETRRKFIQPPEDDKLWRRCVSN